MTNQGDGAGIGTAHKMLAFWMVAWRTYVVIILAGRGAPNAGVVAFAVSVLAGILLGQYFSGVGGKRLLPFPLLRKIFRKPVLAKVSPVRTGTVVSPSPERTLEQASRKGSFSPWMPAEMKNVPAPSPSVFPLMAGLPAAGLSGSGLSHRNVASGSLGEINFSKMLSKAGGQFPLLGRFPSFWSVAMPGPDSLTPDKVQTDIDCVLLIGNEIMLIDVKMFQSGDITYRVENGQLVGRDNLTGLQVGTPKQVSRNMEKAVSRFKHHCGSFKVSAWVVLMPTGNGAAQIDRSVRWPGGVRAVTADEMVQILEKKAAQAGANGELNHYFSQQMSGLLLPG